MNQIWGDLKWALDFVWHLDLDVWNFFYEEMSWD